MKTTVIFVLSLIIASNATAQNTTSPDGKRDFQWMFGYESFVTPAWGGSDLFFHNNKVVAKAKNRKMNFAGTSASICDTAGNLLFYTNGIYVANRQDSFMLNSDSLNPGSVADGWRNDGYPMPITHFILPKPGSDYLYALFHLRATVRGLYDRLHETIVDMRQENGLGAVTQKNKIVIEGDFTGVAATRHANGRDWWILLPKQHTNIYYTFLYDPEGLHGPFSQSDSSDVPTFIESYQAQTNFSIDGNKYVKFDNNNGFYVFDFDRCTGLLSNGKYVHHKVYPGAAAIFSPNGRFLYTTDANIVFQFDTEAADIGASLDTVAVWDGFHSPPNGPPTGFFLSQTGPDGKIYLNCTSYSNAMHTINKPDLKGVACEVCQHCILLPTYNGFTLPYFPNFRLGALIGSPCDTIYRLPVPVPNDDWKLYPNPSSVELSIKKPDRLLGAALSFTLYNSLGKQVFATELPPNNSVTTIELDKLPAAMYFYTISASPTESGGKGALLKSGKVIIQR